MKLKEILAVCPNSRIHLHSGFDGKLVAKTKNSLEAFSEVEVLSIYPKIECHKEADFAYPYLYVFGNSRDIADIKKAREQ